MYRPDLVIKDYQDLLNFQVSSLDPLEAKSSLENISKTILSSNRIHDKRKRQLVQSIDHLHSIYDLIHSIMFPADHEADMLQYFQENKELLLKGGGK